MPCKECFPFKCFPCLKAFEGGKLVMAVALLIVGVMMIVQEPRVINCNEFTAACPAAFEGLLKSLAPTIDGKNNSVAVKANEIASYCGCMSSCMNYFFVYGNNKTSPDKNNCYAKSIAAGVQGNPTPVGKETAGLLGMKGEQGMCHSCEDIQGNEGKVFRALGGIAIACALALTVSSTCEVIGAKARNRCFSLCILSTDVSVLILLAVATVIAVIWYGLSQIACDPDLLSKQLAKAGDASTDGNKDDSAAFSEFLVDLLQPLASGLCGQTRKFAIFALSSFIAYVFTQLTVCATICLCCKWSKDGKIKHITHAKEVQALMSDSSDEE